MMLRGCDSRDLGFYGPRASATTDPPPKPAPIKHFLLEAYRKVRGIERDKRSSTKKPAQRHNRARIVPISHWHRTRSFQDFETPSLGAAIALSVH